jgi:hypothetical protein
MPLTQATDDGSRSVVRHACSAAVHAHRQGGLNASCRHWSLRSVCESSHGSDSGVSTDIRRRAGHHGCAAQDINPPEDLGQRRQDAETGAETERALSRRKTEFMAETPIPTATLTIKIYPEKSGFLGRVWLRTATHGSWSTHVSAVTPLGTIEDLVEDIKRRTSPSKRGRKPSGYEAVRSLWAGPNSPAKARRGW